MQETVALRPPRDRQRNGPANRGRLIGSDRDEYPIPPKRESRLSLSFRREGRAGGHRRSVRSAPITINDGFPGPFIAGSRRTALFSSSPRESESDQAAAPRRNRARARNPPRGPPDGWRRPRPPSPGSSTPCPQPPPPKACPFSRLPSASPSRTSSTRPRSSRDPSIGQGPGAWLVFGMGAMVVTGSLSLDKVRTVADDLRYLIDTAGAWIRTRPTTAAGAVPPAPSRRPVSRGRPERASQAATRQAGRTEAAQAAVLCFSGRFARDDGAKKLPGAVHEREAIAGQAETGTTARQMRSDPRDV